MKTIQQYKIQPICHILTWAYLLYWMQRKAMSLGFLSCIPKIQFALLP